MIQPEIIAKKRIKYFRSDRVAKKGTKNAAKVVSRNEEFLVSQSQPESYELLVRLQTMQSE